MPCGVSNLRAGFRRVGVVAGEDGTAPSPRFFLDGAKRGRKKAIIGESAVEVRRPSGPTS